MSRRTVRHDNPDRSPWLPILLIGIGLAYGLGGLWFLTYADRGPAVAAATQTPRPWPTATAMPYPPTWTPTLRATATTERTPTTVLSSPPTQSAGPQLLTHIAIVHSNDTWGYTLPCG